MTDLACKFCDGRNLKFDYTPCRTEREVRDYSSDDHAHNPFEPCTGARKLLDAGLRPLEPRKCGGHPAEDAFTLPSVSKTEGVKFDNGKLRFDLIPPDALALLAAVLTYGAAKYDDRNWELGMDRARLRAARDRHTNARVLGQHEDPETGLPHLAHEAACTMMELALLLRGVGSDTAAVVPESARLLVEGYTVKAIEAGRVAASRKAVQHV